MCSGRTHHALKGGAVLGKGVAFANPFPKNKREAFMRTDTVWAKDQDTSPQHRTTGEILKSEGTKALEAMARLHDTLRRRKSPEPAPSQKREKKTKEMAPLRDAIPESCSEMVRTAKAFLQNSRSARIKQGLMPETPESHAEIEPLFAGLRPGDISALKGNRLTIDPADKSHVPLLKELLAKCGTEAPGRSTGPTTTPAGFLYHLEDIYRITGKDSPRMQEKTAGKLKHTAEICMAYLEILEEMELEPLPNGDEFSHRASRDNAGVAAAKEALLAQSFADPEPEGTPVVSAASIQEELSGECKPGMTTGEALQIAVILAERKLEHLRSSKKRETLFKMRCHLAHKYFEATKKLRKEGHRGDMVLPQKPRYKTPCVVLVRHPAFEHAEVVCIQPQSALSYWGNPEAEKETHAIIRSKQPAEESGWVAKIKASETVSRAGRWIAAGLVLQIVAASAFLVLKSCHGNKSPGNIAPATLGAAGEQTLSQEALTDPAPEADPAPILIEAGTLEAMGEAPLESQPESGKKTDKPAGKKTSSIQW